MVRFPRGIQQTRLRLLSSCLFFGDGYRFVDSMSRKTLLELKIDIIPVPPDGYAVLELFGQHHVIYSLFVSDELKGSGVSIEKIIDIAVDKISHETKCEARVFAVGCKIDIDHETDPDGTDTVVMWLQDVPIADFIVVESEADTKETIESIQVITPLKGPTIRFQLSQILQHVISNM